MKQHGCSHSKWQKQNFRHFQIFFLSSLEEPVELGFNAKEVLLSCEHWYSNQTKLADGSSLPFQASFSPHFSYPLIHWSCFFVFVFVLHFPLQEIRVALQQEQRYPFLSVSAVFSRLQTLAWLPVFGILNIHTYVDASNCTQGLRRHCTSLHR